MWKFEVPAHEFGHVLGLADESENRLEPESFSALTTYTAGSLMIPLFGIYS